MNQNKIVKKSKLEQELKELLKEGFRNLLNEDVKYNFSYKNQKFMVRFDVNSNPTKKGVKIQFTPATNMIQQPQAARQLANDLQVLLNQRLGAVGMTVDFDADVPYQNVIGFTLKLGSLSNMIINALQNKTQQATEPVTATSQSSQIPTNAQSPVPMKEIKNKKNETKSKF